MEFSSNVGEIMASSAVVEAIQEGVTVQEIQIEGLTYFDRQLHLPPQEKPPIPVQISTLQGLIDVCRQHGDRSGYVLHVESPTKVSLRSVVHTGRHRVAEIVATASCEEFTQYQLRTGSFISVEDMVIQLMAECADLGDRATVLDTISRITTQDISKLIDDGVSQAVVVEKGFKVQEAPLKNIVTLHPYSTFREIDQPGRQFLLRMKQGRDGGKGTPVVALFRADGDGWKLTAMESIKSWLLDACLAARIEMEVIA